LQWQLLRVNLGWFIQDKFCSVSERKRLIASLIELILRLKWKRITSCCFVDFLLIPNVLTLEDILASCFNVMNIKWLLWLLWLALLWDFVSPGGLDSWDRSRSRSRTSFVSRLTFLKCRDYPSRRDQLFFFSVNIFKIKVFKIEIFWSRFIFVEIFIEIVETNRDCWDLSRLLKFIETFEIYREFLRFLDIIKTFSRLFRDFRLKNLDKLKNLDRELW
jgi:hypothetical protein